MENTKIDQLENIKQNQIEYVQYFLFDNFYSPYLLGIF